jgi:photosystem II stability/assembly factor-like uncharacterized protein
MKEIGMTNPIGLPLSGTLITGTLLTALMFTAPAEAQRTRQATSRASAAPAYDTLLYNGLQFRMVGPFRGGRSTAVTGIAGQPHTFYMGATGGGVWKTEDAGHSWHNVSDGYFGGSIGALDIADTDPNVIYIGTGSACIRGNTSPGHGMYKSVDGGQSWSFAGLPEAGQIGRVVVHPTNPELVYVAALGHAFGKNKERGVFRSQDGGKTWQNVLFLNDSTGAVDLSINPQNPRIIFAGMWRAERKPWTMISGGPEGGVYRSKDGGDTWEKLAGGLPTGIVGKVAVSVSPANPNRVWAMIEAEPEGGVYRSDDGGNTWTRTNSENKLRQRAWYYTHIIADPQDENTVYGLNVNFFRSVDGGKTFESFDVPHGDVHDLWINPVDNRLMVVGDDGGAQVSLTAAKAWSTMYNQPTAEFYDLVVDNGFPFRLYSSQQDNTSISVPAWSSSSTLHPKQHWQYASGCETGPVALHPDQPNVIWGGCYGGAINRMDLATEERRNQVIYPQLQLGQAAKDLRYRFQWVAPIMVSRHDPNTVYHASQMVHRTRDGGMTWETISPDLTTNTPAHQEAAGGPINNDVTGVEMFNTIFALAESSRDPNILWAGSDDGRVHVTRDGGQSWQDVTPRGLPPLSTVDVIELSPHAEGRAYLGAHRYRLDDMRPFIFRTDDYGRTWTLLTDGRNGIPVDHPVRAVREDPVREGLVYAGTEFGLFASWDGGRRWQPLQMNLPITPVVDLRVQGSDLAISTQGRSFWVLDDVTPLRQLSPEVTRSRVHLYAPRPTHRVSTGGQDVGPETPDPRPEGAMIHFYLAEEPADSIKLEILDARGQVVRTFTSDTAAARKQREPAVKAKRGTNRFVWDLTYAAPRAAEGQVIWGFTGGPKAPPGEYQVRLTASGETRTQPLQVLGDPRLTQVTQADYQEQFRLAMAVRDTLAGINEAVEDIRSIKEQATRAVERAEKIGRADQIRPLADSLKARLTEIEQALTQTRSQSGQDPIRFAGRLDNQFAELYGNIAGPNGYISGGPEGLPTRGARERLEDLNREWAAIRARLQQVVGSEVTAFNTAVTQAGVTPVVVPTR